MYLFSPLSHSPRTRYLQQQASCTESTRHRPFVLDTARCLIYCLLASMTRLRI